MEVYSETETTFNPDHQTIDITEHVAGVGGRGMESRVRFRWTGDASWFWMLDNVRVLRVDLAVNPNGCPRNAPYKCAADGACVEHEAQCLLDNGCPRERPVRCLDGACVAAGADEAQACSDLIDCAAGAVRCANGACAANVLECHAANNCPLTRPQRCADGSCAANARDCPLVIACPDEFAPYPCRGGACAAAPELCPTLSPVDLVCPCDQVQCPDLTCAASYAECACPCEYPYLCVESRTCVQESIYCKDTALPAPSVVAEQFGGAGAAVRMVRVAECPQGHFRCFDGTCVASLTQCADVPAAAFETNSGAALAVKCPDGSAARARDECAPVPACGSRWLRRCANGACVHVNDECADVAECTFGRERGADGRCYAPDETPAYHGCGVDKPFECPNGRCACNAAQCFAGCGPKQHVCFDGDECRAWAEDCDAEPSDHRAVPFSGNLNCIAIREDALYYDVIIVPDRNFDDLFATVMIPAGILEKQDESAEIVALDVPLSEVRPLPPFPQAISHVLGVELPASVFANDEFVRITMRVELPVGASVDDYCLAQLAEFDDGEREWRCVDSALVQDGAHFSGLVQDVRGVFVILKKPGVCHNYRGFADAQLDFILLGRTIPRQIHRLQQLHNRLTAIRDRFDEIKRSDAVLTHIAKATYGFTEQCLSEQWMAQLSTFPEQLGFTHPPIGSGKGGDGGSGGMMGQNGGGGDMGQSSNGGGQGGSGSGSMNNDHDYHSSGPHGKY